MGWITKLLGCPAMLIAFAGGHGAAWAQALLPLDVDATCRALYGEASPGAALHIAGNLESLGCKYPAGQGEEAVGYLSPAQMCLRRAPNLVAVWLNLADWKAWACAEPGAQLPTGSLSTAQPAPPLRVPSVGGELDEKYRSWFERHVVPVTPAPFHRAARAEDGQDVLYRLTSNNGTYKFNASYFPQRYFARDTWVVVTSSEASLRRSQAVGAVSRLYADLAATAPELARNTARVIIFTRGLQGVPNSSRDEYARAGFDVWSPPGAQLNYDRKLAKSHLIPIENRLAFVDRHGYVRAWADPTRLALATDKPEPARSRPEQWLQHVYSPVHARPLAPEISLTRLLQETVLAGKLAASPQAMPSRLVLPRGLVSQIAGLRARTAIVGTEIGATLLVDDGALQLETVGAENQTFETDMFADMDALFATLMQPDPNCGAGTCPAIFSGRLRIGGNFHTHPSPDLFSLNDVLSTYSLAEVSVLSVNTGEIAVLMPTAASMVAPDDMAGRIDISSHRTAGMFMLPGRMQSCAVEIANRRMWDIGMKASAYGLALYVGQGDALVRVDAPEAAQRFAARPVLGMLDARGGLADPLSRLRVAMLLRSDMPLEAVADDLSPADAFDPLLSAKSRALLKGRALDSTMIEGLFQTQANRHRLLRDDRNLESAERLSLTVNAPNVMRASGRSRVLREDNSCKEYPSHTLRWILQVQDVQGTGLAAKYRRVADATWVELVTTTDPQRIADNCAAELQFFRPADASGRRVVDMYCEGGDAFKGVYDENKNRFDDAYPRQPRWKP